MRNILDASWDKMKWVNNAICAPIAASALLVRAFSVVLENCLGIQIPLFPKWHDPRHITKSEV